MPRTAWTLRRALKWALLGTLALLVVLPPLLYFAFLGIQEASERQWLGRAPTHNAIDVRLQQPHPVALLDVGFDSLATRLRLIEEARTSIELEFFIYEVDTASRLVTQALARKAREGVKVRLLVDFSLPVFKLAPHYAHELAAAGVQVRYYNTAGLARFFAFNHRTHRKLLVVDRAKAIIGGRNIGDDYFDLSGRYNFLDSDLLIHGPVSAAIADSFDLYWASDWVARPGDVAGAEAPDAPELLGPASTAEATLLAELQRHVPQHAPSTCPDIHFVTDYPGSGVERRKVFTELTRLAQEARQQILIESPYLVLREDGTAVLSALARRGVQLTLLTNSLTSTDAFYTVASLANGLDQLRQLPGLQVWAYGGQPLAGSARPPASPRWGVHAKRAVFDDHTVVVGTYNIDPRSANLNSELMVVCRGNRTLAAELQASIRARLAQSRPVVGTASAGGDDTLVEGADRDTLLMMRAIAPFTRLLDILM
ncbi:phosphatidylserine/phosphatidylglycerophosphate/cardiolipin synthase family protein [Hydrogenophaga sp.]|uniref:phospholipase D-like domain-containing protein n=1 Tax=Hydrogenophaga sp. TaxID=1904254 RepID=UPI00286DEA12|nr:phosphatidylserine/phosphatidylglycerophosphate/cardiolipin synthase family protein [Hydrogenophaga sp.]